MAIGSQGRRKCVRPPVDPIDVLSLGLSDIFGKKCDLRTKTNKEKLKGGGGRFFAENRHGGMWGGGV